MAPSRPVLYDPLENRNTAIDLQSFIQTMDAIAQYSGDRVVTAASDDITATNLDAAIAQLAGLRQKLIEFQLAGVTQGNGTIINAGSGLGMGIAGDVVTLSAGATASSQSFGSNLILSTTPDQYIGLTATTNSLTVSLQQTGVDRVTHLYNAGAETFTVLGNIEGDPYYDQTKLLILGEGTIVDVSPTPKALTLTGNTALSTDFAKFGTQAIKFDGTGDYLSAGAIGDWNFLHDGTTAWVFDLEIRLTNTTGTILATATSGTQKGINIAANGTIVVYNGTGGQTVFSGSFTPPATGSFSHLAIGYNPAAVGGAKLYVWVNGTLATTLTQNSAPATGNSATALILGNQTTGYWDAVRITTALRYTGNFTPSPTVPPSVQRIGTYFTVPILPGINATFVHDPAVGWKVPFLLPQFQFREEGVNVAAVGQITALNYTGASQTATLAGGVLTLNSTAIAASEKGAVNGVATLDGSGLIPSSQMPVSAMEFKGTWNASTNTPTLIDGTGNTGDVYRVSVAGTRNLGSGSQTFGIADWILYNGTIWQRVINTESVASVFGRSGIISAQSGDYTATQITNTPAGNIASTTVQAAVNELDTEKQAAIQWQDEGSNQGTSGQGTRVNATGAGVTLSYSAGTVTLNIPGAGTLATLTLQEQGSAPTPGANEATLYVDATQILRYREESSGTINQIAVLGRHQTYTAAQGTAQSTLTDATNISVNAALSNAFTVTLGGNRTLDNPTNTISGFTYVFRIVQDATGSRTLAYGTNYKFPGGTAPVLSNAPNAVDILTCYCAANGGNLNCNLTKDFR